MRCKLKRQYAYITTSHYSGHESTNDAAIVRFDCSNKHKEWFYNWKRKDRIHKWCLQVDSYFHLNILTFLTMI